MENFKWGNVIYETKLPFENQSQIEVHVNIGLRLKGKRKKTLMLLQQWILYKTEVGRCNGRSTWRKIMKIYMIKVEQRLKGDKWWVYVGFSDAG